MENAMRNLEVLRDTPPWEWPEDTAAVLLAVLRDAGAAEADRLVAAELAGDPCVVDDDLVGALLAITADTAEPEELRGQAAIALGPVLELGDTDEFDDPEAVPITEATFQHIRKSLRRLCEDASAPAEVRRRALEASVRAPEAWHDGAVRAALASNDSGWRLTAVFCMGWVRGFDEEIVGALEGGDPDVAYEAVCAAANWGVAGAWPHVAALVRSPGTGKLLLLAAIDAVASIRPDEATEVLAPLADAEDEDVVDAVHEALALVDAELEDAWEEDEFDD